MKKTFIFLIILFFSSAQALTTEQYCYIKQNNIKNVKINLVGLYKAMIIKSANICNENRVICNIPDKEIETYKTEENNLTKLINELLYDSKVISNQCHSNIEYSNIYNLRIQMEKLRIVSNKCITDIKDYQKRKCIKINKEESQ